MFNNKNILDFKFHLIFNSYFYFGIFFIIICLHCYIIFNFLKKYSNSKKKIYTKILNNNLISLFIITNNNNNNKFYLNNHY